MKKIFILFISFINIAENYKIHLNVKSCNMDWFASKLKDSTSVQDFKHKLSVCFPNATSIFGKNIDNALFFTLKFISKKNMNDDKKLKCELYRFLIAPHLSPIVGDGLGGEACCTSTHVKGVCMGGACIPMADYDDSFESCNEERLCGGLTSDIKLRDLACEGIRPSLNLENYELLYAFQDLNMLGDEYLKCLLDDNPDNHEAVSSEHNQTCIARLEHELDNVKKKLNNKMTDKELDTLFPVGKNSHLNFSLVKHWLLVAQCRARYSKDPHKLYSCVHSRMGESCLEQGVNGAVNCIGCGANLHKCNKVSIINYRLGFKGENSFDVLKSAIYGDFSGVDRGLNKVSDNLSGRSDLHNGNFRLGYTHCGFSWFESTLKGSKNVQDLKNSIAGCMNVAPEGVTHINGFLLDDFLFDALGHIDFSHEQIVLKCRNQIGVQTHQDIADDSTSITMLHDCVKPQVDTCMEQALAGEASCEGCCGWDDTCKFRCNKISKINFECGIKGNCVDGLSFKDYLNKKMALLR